jgi:PAS domain-containing protein
MWLAVSVYCPEPGRFIAVFDVITERVKAEHALRAANTLLERTEAIAHVGSWRLDVSSGSVSWSAEMYRIFGLDPSEPALTATEILARAIHPDDRHIMAAAQGAFGIGEVRPLDLRIVLPGGEVRVVHMDGEVQNDDQGRPVALFGFAQDVTASRHS